MYVIINTNNLSNSYRAMSARIDNSTHIGRTNIALTRSPAFKTLFPTQRIASRSKFGQLFAKAIRSNDLNRIDTSNEPSIEQRIIKAINVLSIGISKEKIGQFLSHCGKFLYIDNAHSLDTQLLWQTTVLESLASLKQNGLTQEEQLKLFTSRQNNNDLEQIVLMTAKNIYDNARGSFRKPTEDFITSLNNPGLGNIKMKALLTCFMNKTGNPGIRFIENLTKLAQKHVSDTHKVFLNAAEAQVQNIRVNGFYNEPIAALTLSEKGFTVEKLSLTEDDSGIPLDGNGRYREIDIVAKKDSQIYYIDVKSSVHSLSSHWKNSKNQIRGLIEITQRYNAVPVILLMRLPIPTEHAQEIKGLREIITEYPTLRVLNDRAEDITEFFTSFYQSS